jgi:hypothetical protein
MSDVSEEIMECEHFIRQQGFWGDHDGQKNNDFGAKVALLIFSGNALLLGNCCVVFSDALFSVPHDMMVIPWDNILKHL